ncbi:MAG: glucan biosynthesis protein G [Candidatus Omnitrophota bacterium]
MMNTVSYKRVVYISCIMLSLWSGDCLSSPATFFRDVVKKAEALSKEPFDNANNLLPEQLRNIQYDEWRDLRFDSTKSLWGEEDFSVQFFHPGYIYLNSVRINYVDKNIATKLPFSQNFFDYSQSALKGTLIDTDGFAGFRIHYPINSPVYKDEVISFLGASYFRALGKDLAYGMSSRALAIDTAEPTGEEFPFFSEFWILHPAQKARKIMFYGLLESKSLTGAYSFVVYPGEKTRVDVKSVLFFRKKVKKLGLAPLTSMFFYGENSASRAGMDFRPEVHDSDGLLIEGNSGEWTWHPLVNPENLLINSFGGGQPRGFGLIQRDMDFDHYQDLEARYDKRPGVWVVPDSDWGPGHLELLQIPTQNEYNDNIGAFWIIERPFEPGDSFEYNYSLTWYAGNNKRSRLATVEATRVVTKNEDVMFIVDFLSDPAQTALLTEDLTPDIEIFNNYSIISSQIIKNTVTNGWRLVILVNLDQKGLLDKMLPHKPAVELRAFLQSSGKPVTETWSYTYLPSASPGFAERRAPRGEP